jgi:hypothetical protein
MMEQRRGDLRVLACLAGGLALSGCSWLGPELIRSGRPAYNDAILATSDEQLLQNVVRMRFTDSIGFLTVSSVTANVSFTTTGTVNLGFGPQANYAGNLVPFTGTVTNEQNPTISYTPVGGDSLLKQFAGEIPLDRVVILLNNSKGSPQAWYTLINRVNNLRNPGFPVPPHLVVDPRFDELVKLTSDLQRNGSLYWVKLAGAQSGNAIVLHSYSPHSDREVARLLALLNVAKPERVGDDVVIPVQLSVGSPGPNSMSIETRSLVDLFRLAAASIEIPPDVTGAEAVPTPGPAGKGIRIRSSALFPQGSRVAAQYRGRWYYVDNDDQLSKEWFWMLQLLVAAQLPDTSAGGAPVLTIPVSRR